MDKCEDTDKGCPNCKGKCLSQAETTLIRTDREDKTGVLFCDACAVDALDSGLFDCK